MPKIQFGLSSYERSRGDISELPVVNMFAEQASPEGVVLQSRPGLVSAGTMGPGPIHCLFKGDNVLDSALFGVSDTVLYRGSEFLGEMDGAGPFSIAGYESHLFAAGGGNLWCYDGAEFSQVAFPDGAAVVKVLIGASRLIALRADTQQYYFSGPLETEIEALDFTSAENQPDRLLDALFIDGLLILFGAETVEFHTATGEANLPFVPIQARVIERGIKEAGCAAALGPTFAWVTDKNEVCFQNETSVISNPGLEARIKASETCALFTLFIEGTEFLALRLDDETQLWCKRTGAWSEFASNGQDNWIVRTSAGNVMGSAIDGRLFEWSQGHDDAGEQLERRFRGGFPIDGASAKIDNLRLRCNIGQAVEQTGEYAEAFIEMRLSDDAGRTWGAWEAESLGKQGEYRAEPEWRALGLASYPAFLCEFRITDPVDFRVSGVMVNEPYEGR